MRDVLPVDFTKKKKNLNLLKGRSKVGWVDLKKEILLWMSAVFLFLGGSNLTELLLPDDGFDVKCRFLEMADGAKISQNHGRQYHNCRMTLFGGNPYLRKPPNSIFSMAISGTDLLEVTTMYKASFKPM